MLNLEDAKKVLLEKDCSLVVIKDEKIYEFYNERIIDLKNILLQDKDGLKDAIVADKVIGKVAGSLMIAGGVKSVYSKVVSSLIVDKFRENNINLEYEEIIPFIKNKDKTGMCPMEQKFKNEEDIQKIYETVINVV